MEHNNQTIKWIPLIFIGNYIFAILLMTLYLSDSGYMAVVDVILLASLGPAALPCFSFLGLFFLIKRHPNFDFPKTVIFRKTKISLYAFWGMYIAGYVLCENINLTLNQTLFLMGATIWLNAIMFECINRSEFYAVIRPIMNTTGRMMNVSNRTRHSQSLTISHPSTTAMQHGIVIGSSEHLYGVDDNRHETFIHFNSDMQRSIDESTHHELNDVHYQYAFNIDGTPMLGEIDLYGNPYGVVNYHDVGYQSHDFEYTHHHDIDNHYSSDDGMHSHYTSDDYTHSVDHHSDYNPDSHNY